MIEVTIVGSLVYIRHKHKVTSTILAAYDYERSMPEELIEPGLISDRERKKIKPVKFYEDQVCICYYKDKQFWLGLKYWKTNKLCRELWHSFKDQGYCWQVPSDFNHRAEYFSTESEAQYFIKVSKRNVEPKQIVINNPEDRKWIVKLPWVSLLLEDYDIAKEWDEYMFDKFEYLDICRFVMIIKAFKEWEKGNDKI